MYAVFRLPMAICLNILLTSKGHAQLHRILSDSVQFAFLRQRTLLAVGRCSQRIVKEVSSPHRRLYKLAESTNGL